MRQNNWRIKLVASFIILLAGILIVCLFRLQVQYNEKYKLISDKNRIRIVPILPKRGRILTSDNKVIANSIHKYKLLIENCNSVSFADNMHYLQNKIGLSADEITTIIAGRKARDSFYVAKNSLSWDEFSKISMDLFKLNHLSIIHSYCREYNDSKLYCHITGYTTQTDNSIQLLAGKTGIELLYDQYLAGELGSNQVEVNAFGKAMRTLDTISPIDGKDLVITINAEMQQYIYDLIAEHQAGACVVLDLEGNVIALVSVPGFDTNLMSNKISKKQWDELRQDPLFPLLNRAITCAYPPGSIFKIIVAFAALSEGIISPDDKIYCAGGVKQDKHVFHCWNRAGHGYMNLYDAIRLSCDCYFFEISKKLGIDKIVDYAKKFGYGSKTGIEMPNESSGLMPTKQWKLLKYKTIWRPYETMIAGIGQGAVLATLIQTATAFGKLYSGNFLYTPHLIQQGDTIAQDPIDQKYATVIKQALESVCKTGTASLSCKAKYGIAGKTGSSQVRKIKSNEVGKKQNEIDWQSRDHAFFAGVAPLPNPKYIVAVFIEHGGGGGSVAAPIARKIFDKLMQISKK